MPSKGPEFDEVVARTRLAEDLGFDGVWGFDGMTTLAALMKSSSVSLSGSLDDALRKTEALRDLGVRYLICGWPGQGRQRVEAYAPRLLAEFSDAD